MSVAFLEFFAGAGLVRLGLERAGFVCRFANDIDAKKGAIYAENFGAAHLIVGDIHDLKPSAIPAARLATASFPCTDLSLAGGRGGLRAGRQSSAFFGFTELIAKLPPPKKPAVLLLENVQGFLSSGRGEDIRIALAEINRIGYAVDLFSLDARLFVPQSRPRLFIVARRSRRRSSTGEEFFARRHPALKTARLARVVERLRGEIRFSFLDIPAPPEPDGARVADLLEPAAVWWPKKRVDALVRQMPEKTRKRLTAAVDAPLVGTIFRRIRNGTTHAEGRFDGVAGCLRTPRGGSSKQIVVSAAGGTIRARHLTAREAARLMGVEESFVLPQRQNAGLFALGDAVCVPLFAWIGAHVLRPLLD